MEEQFDKEIHALAQQIKGLHDQAVAVYTPLVDDICSRVAPMKEVEWLLDYMFGFAGKFTQGVGLWGNETENCPAYIH